MNLKKMNSKEIMTMNMISMMTMMNTNTTENQNAKEDLDRLERWRIYLHSYLME